MDSPRDAYDFTDRVLFEPFWLDGHKESYEVDPGGATESLLKAFDTTFHQHKTVSRWWIVLRSNSHTTDEQSQKQEQTYQNLRFMTVDEYKAKIMTK